MLAAIGPIRSPEALHWPVCAAILLAASGILWLRSRRLAAQQQKDRRLLNEFEAYELIDLRLPAGADLRESAAAICHAISRHSAFYRVALFLRDGQNRFFAASGTGMESACLHALETWAGDIAEAERSRSAGSHLHLAIPGVPVGRRSFIVFPESRSSESRSSEPRPGSPAPEAVIVLPLRSAAGRVLGLLAVCAAGAMSVHRSTVEEALIALEVLALKLSRRIENAAQAERLLRAERLAGMGLIAGSLTHQLNGPLTAVLGFSELIADTSTETRVRTDAGMIMREALRMRHTIEQVRDLLHPSLHAPEPIDLSALIRQIAAECRGELAGRGVALLVEASADLLSVRGARGRIRQMVEHLLNNAAQAIDTVEPSTGHAIRISLCSSDLFVHMVVSDSGPGFAEPWCVFDPSGATHPSAAGLGLGICQSIVREHGGEICAFNPDTGGAAVSIDLPALPSIPPPAPLPSESTLHAARR